MRLSRHTFLLASLLLLAAHLGSQSHSAAYLRMERKLAAMQRFESSPVPAGLTTILSDEEINAWLSEGGIRWPAGVDNVRLQSQPAVITGTARVDFDKITAGRNGVNPLLMLFSGEHDVRVVAQATASGGRGAIHVDSVYLDDVKVPRMALEIFIERYLRRRHPYIGLDNEFTMPHRIDTAIVGNRQITFVQK